MANDNATERHRQPRLRDQRRSATVRGTGAWHTAASVGGRPNARYGPGAPLTDQTGRPIDSRPGSTGESSAQLAWIPIEADRSSQDATPPPEVDVPWRETDRVMERMKFITGWLGAPSEASFAEFCRSFGVSRQTGYKWIQRFETGGAAALDDRPPLAVEHKNATSAAIADRVAELRKAHPTWGPKKLRALLARELPAEMLPATSTVGEIISRRGLIAPRKRRIRVPPSATPLSNYSGPNAVWCVDHKGDFPLLDGTRCGPLTLIDGFSRYLLRCEVVPSTADDVTRAHVVSALREYGVPLALRSDGGPPFAVANTPGRLTQFAIAMLKQGIELHRNDPGCPQQNGRLERFHKTLNEAIDGGPYSRDEQQRRFDFFRKEYNYERPHEALEQRIPARSFETSWRAYQEQPRPPEYDNPKNVRLVDSGGRFHWRDEPWTLGRSFAGEYVYVQPWDDDIGDVYIFRHFLGTLDRRGERPLIRFDPPPPKDERRRPPLVQFS